MNLDTNLDVEVTTGTFSPTEIWDRREEWTKQIEDSKQEWKTMTEEEQETLAAIVRHGCLRLADKTEEWVPEGITFKGGSTIDVTFKIMLTDATKSIARQAKRVFSATDDEVRELAVLADEHPVVAKLIEQLKSNYK